jgi:hypothetical protein
MVIGDNIKDRILSSLMASFILFLLPSLFISLLVKNKKVKKIIYAFCISLFVCYIVSGTIFNFFYESDF